MITIIAEKPSVAQSIAAVVGARERCDGYLSGNGYYVTWAYGHLMELAAPEQYGYPVKWEKSALPIIPDNFEICPITPKDEKTGKLYKKQLSVISSLFRKSEKIIAGTDAGREGELIFRYIYDYLKKKGHVSAPFERLWISSLTDKAIMEGMRNLRPGADYDRMFYAGKARSTADWLIGINATRAVTLNVADRSVWPVGRVQTPTLAMICRRFIANRDFKSEPFFQLKIAGEKNGLTFWGFNPARFKTKEEAAKIKGGMAGKKMTVCKVEKKPAYSMPPLLYDLTSIQKEANSRFGMSADMTLKLCQSLYEKKLATYPRTGSRYIPDDVYETLPALIRNAGSHPKFSDYAASLRGKVLGKISVNAAKVTDHHALLPTENIPEEGQMTDAERKIYELIVGRMLETVSPREEKEVTTAVILIDGIPGFPFTVKGSVIRAAGWKAVMGEKAACDEEENEKLPPLEAGESLAVKDAVILEKKTKAPPLLTENSLLALMEACGKELEDEDEREALKDIGLGTPATRAETIEKLIRSKYVVREKKNLVPTEKGLALYDTVKGMRIADVEMTGKWENALNKIEQGRADADMFNEEIKKYTASCTEELLGSKVDTSKIRQEGSGRKELACPKCGGKFIVTDKVCACTNKEECGFFFWRVVCQRKLGDREVREILAKGETKGKVKLKKKDGTAFEAKLVLKDDGKFAFKW